MNKTAPLILQGGFVFMKVREKFNAVAVNIKSHKEYQIINSNSFLVNRELITKSLLNIAQIN